MPPEPGRDRRAHRAVARGRAAPGADAAAPGLRARDRTRVHARARACSNSASATSGSLNLTDLAQPLLEDLARKVNQSSSMAVLDGQSHRLRAARARAPGHERDAGRRRAPAGVLRVDGPRAAVGPGRARLDRWLAQCKPVKLHPAHGDRPAPRCAASSSTCATQGYAYVEQELELGLCSIAVPVRNADGRIATAINVSMPYHPEAARHAHRATILPRTAADARRPSKRCVPANRLPAAAS